MPRRSRGRRLTRELGVGVQSADAPVIINFRSNVDPMKLRRGVEAAGEPDDPE